LQDATPAATIDVSAASPGVWANGLQLVVSAGTQAGTIKLIILSQTNVQLEAYDNLSISSSSSNYWVTRINSVSNYIDVTVVGSDQPVVGTFALSGGNDGVTGITDADYIGGRLNAVATGMQTVADSTVISINIILCPGISSIATQTALVALAQNRSDCLALLDAPQGLGPQDVYNYWNALSPYTARTVINSSYAATHYPWVQMYDTYNQVYTSVPASAWALWAITNSANLENIWSAPAGELRAVLTPATGIDITLAQVDRDLMYPSGINPIANFPGTGIVIWGQKTLTNLLSAVNRMNVRLMINVLKTMISAAVRPVVFQPNIPSTYRQLRSLTDPILRSMSGNNAFNPYAPNNVYDGGYLIVCDSSINTPAVVAQNQLIAQFFVRPALSSEFITLQYIITPQGASLSGDSTFASLSSAGALGN
jgi:phage tail sheath protein FI